MQIMKKCLFCGKEPEEENSDMCETCLNFFKWKHAGKLPKRLRKFRALIKQDRKFNKTKLGRKK